MDLDRLLKPGKDKREAVSTEHFAQDLSRNGRGRRWWIAARVLCACADRCKSPALERRNIQSKRLRTHSPR